MLLICVICRRGWQIKVEGGVLFPASAEVRGMKSLKNKSGYWQKVACFYYYCRADTFILYAAL